MNIHEWINFKQLNKELPENAKIIVHMIINGKIIDSTYKNSYILFDKLLFFHKNKTKLK